MLWKAWCKKAFPPSPEMFSTVLKIDIKFCAKLKLLFSLTLHQMRKFSTLKTFEGDKIDVNKKL